MAGRGKGGAIDANFLWPISHVLLDTAPFVAVAVSVVDCFLLGIPLIYFMCSYLVPVVGEVRDDTFAEEQRSTIAPEL